MEDNNAHDRLNEEKWDRRAKTFDESRFNYFRFMQKRLVSLLDLKEGQRLLDMGCGTGWAVRYAASRTSDRGEFYGVDISSKMIEKARESSSDFENVHFCKSSSEQLPFADDFFDLTICSNYFHHYFSPDRVLGQVYRVLKRQARIYILDGTADSFIVRMANRRARKKDSSHVKLYSTQEYKTLFAEAKLNYVATKSIWGLLYMKIHIGEKRP